MLIILSTQVKHEINEILKIHSIIMDLTFLFFNFFVHCELRFQLSVKRKPFIILRKKMYSYN